MNCEYCRTKLNPYLLKQASHINGELIFEIECLDCRKYNYLSEESYFYVKKDHMMPLVKPINNKLPKDMNVIIDSVERCGISWVIRGLSQYHKPMFNFNIPFAKHNAEISHQIATKNRLPLPKQWNNCYGIDPQLLLDRVDPEGQKYDRVLVIQRDLKTQEWVDRIFLAQEGLAQDFIEKIIAKMKEEYKIVYRDDINDPRYLKVNLEDINNYSTDVMNELMDFFNFPEVGRPPVVPFKPHWFERNWEALSSILQKGFELTGRLARIRDKFQITKDGLLEFLTTNPSIRKEIKTTKKVVEYKKLENILILGSQLLRGCHFGENIYKAFTSLGYGTRYLYAQLFKNKLTKEEYDRYLQKKERYPISKVLDSLDKKPELIVVDQIGFSWKNDVNVPIFYMHNFFKRPPIINYPTVAFFRHEAVANYFEKMFAPYWCERVDALKIMSVAFDPNNFVLSNEKKYVGISCLAGRENMTQLKSRLELTAIAMVIESMREIREFQELGLRWIDDGGGIMDIRYRELLPQLEALWVCIPLGQYVSRRILEAMYCKTVVVIKIEGDYHQEILEQMGFVAGEHYVKIDKLDEMVELNKNWDFSKYKKMIEKAHNLVLNKHTFECRAKEIIGVYKEMRDKNEA